MIRTTRVAALAAAGLLAALAVPDARGTTTPTAPRADRSSRPDRYYDQHPA